MMHTFEFGAGTTSRIFARIPGLSPPPPLPLGPLPASADLPLGFLPKDHMINRLVEDSICSQFDLINRLASPSSIFYFGMLQAFKCPILTK